MMKFLLLALFSMFCPVQPSSLDETIIASNGKILYYENSPATFICTKNHAIWMINRNKLSECNCPGKCGDVLFDSTRITAHCNGSSPVLHFKQMKLTDNSNRFKCVDSLWDFSMMVGNKNDNFYPKKSFALVDNNYSLVCEKEEIQGVYLYDENTRIGNIDYDNYIDNFDEENFTITVEQSKITLLIKKVALKDDGKIFGCFLWGNHLSLLNLTVNVPVSSVSFHRENKVLIEGETRTFVCKVNESKPKASFEWILSENGSEIEITENIDITSKQNGKLWQTTSTLKLKLKRSFHTIKCRARIEKMAWTNSTSLPLDVVYAPEITISYEMAKNEIQCSADANPSNITYELVQKWGSVVKKKVNGGKMVFKYLTYQDLGEWTCRASNGVPTNTGKKYSQMSVEVKDNIQAEFNGDETQQAIIGHQKSIKVCFYCHPEATAVEWRSENGKISSDKSVYSRAEDGQFPFTGNCSTLTLDITETSAKKYDIMVENELGNRKFYVNLDITKPEVNMLVIILSSVIPALIIIMIISGGIIFVKYRKKSTKKKAAMANRPLPAQPKLNIYESFYDTIEMQQNENESSKYVYENHEEIKEDELRKHTYKNL